MFISRSLLARHVLESNAIEGIRFRSGRFFNQHIQAARLVATHPAWKPILDPREIHRLLLQDILLPREVGAYRTVPIWVGSTRCPEPQYIPDLMEQWMVWAVSCRNLDPIRVEMVATFLHDHFLCIHPFTDGNGRTARLLLNHLRLRNGMGWEVTPFDKRDLYYARIQAYEQRIFKREYPQTYLTPDI